MPKCDFNKVAFFRTAFPYNTSGWLLLNKKETLRVSEIYGNILKDLLFQTKIFQLNLSKIFRLSKSPSLQNNKLLMYSAGRLFAFCAIITRIMDTSRSSNNYRFIQIFK